MQSNLIEKGVQEIIALHFVDQPLFARNRMKRLLDDMVSDPVWNRQVKQRAGSAASRIQCWYRKTTKTPFRKLLNASHALEPSSPRGVVCFGDEVIDDPIMADVIPVRVAVFLRFGYDKCVCYNALSLIRLMVETLSLKCPVTTLPLRPRHIKQIFNVLLNNKEHDLANTLDAFIMNIDHIRVAVSDKESFVSGMERTCESIMEDKIVRIAVNETYTTQYVHRQVSFGIAEWQTEVQQYFKVFPDECIAMLRRTIIMCERLMENNDYHGALEQKFYTALIDLIKSCDSQSQLQSVNTTYLPRYRNEHLEKQRKMKICIRDAVNRIYQRLNLQISNKRVSNWINLKN